MPIGDYIIIAFMIIGSLIMLLSIILAKYFIEN